MEMVDDYRLIKIFCMKDRIRSKDPSRVDFYGLYVWWSGGMTVDLIRTPFPWYILKVQGGNV